MKKNALKSILRRLNFMLMVFIPKIKLQGFKGQMRRFFDVS